CSFIYRDRVDVGDRSCSAERLVLSTYEGKRDSCVAGAKVQAAIIRYASADRHRVDNRGSANRKHGTAIYRDIRDHRYRQGSGIVDEQSRIAKSFHVNVRPPERRWLADRDRISLGIDVDRDRVPSGDSNVI